MSERLVTFRIDRTVLFDRLSEHEDFRRALGDRLIAVLLAEPSFRDAVGLAIYGVELVPTA